MSTLREAAQQALEALMWHDETVRTRGDNEAIAALRAALAQQEQEPVAHFGSAYVNENGVHITTVLGPVAIPQDAKLYTHPPRREWRGLSEEERADILFPLTAAGASDMECARAIEAALKERNT
jgi:hypothetical protein